MSNVDRIMSKYILDGGFLFLIGVMRGIGFMSVDVVIFGIVMICIRMFNIGNIYVVNK